MFTYLHIFSSTDKTATINVLKVPFVLPYIYPYISVPLASDWFVQTHVSQQKELLLL